MDNSTHGGARKGAGRKPSPDRLIRIDARLSKSQIEFLNNIDPNVSKAIRTITDQQRSKMKIYKVTQGHELAKQPTNIFDLPKVTYHKNYANALKVRDGHGGELSKYGNCHDADHNNRETWVERNIPLGALEKLLWNVKPETIETEIELIEVN